MATTQPRRSRKGSLATLIALLALAGVAQALAPVSAPAMIDQNLGTCTRITGNLGWNYATDKPCTISGGGGAVAIPGTGRPGEVVVIEDTAPPEDVIPCLEPRFCVPPDGGDRDQQVGYPHDYDPKVPGGFRATKAAPKDRNVQCLENKDWLELINYKKILALKAQLKAIKSPKKKASFLAAHPNLEVDIRAVERAAKKRNECARWFPGKYQPIKL